MNEMTSRRKPQCRRIKCLASVSDLRRGIVILALVNSLVGCTRVDAPSFSLLGSYFPSWLACAFIGVVAAAAARVFFIRIGIDEALPWRLFVYLCLALAVAFVCSLLVFAR
ncbi:YtcA family lipoprotein [Serratia sp. UGAL515B_01]|uniref:YtcA family lipoprotein n=1 Tax=Serratia sp. UGAL515B_01 TaxID=2986763 RepID=UPI002953A988|nr:YtcA family lipoprotein [Serratia sp. UGAL515B_01]WON78413.1 YtcA family lipoprotein [Serratia sp. UGAL515B_01]